MKITADGLVGELVTRAEFEDIHFLTGDESVAIILLCSSKKASEPQKYEITIRKVSDDVPI